MPWQKLFNLVYMVPYYRMLYLYEKQWLTIELINQLHKSLAKIFKN